MSHDTLPQEENMTWDNRGLEGLIEHLESLRKPAKLPITDVITPRFMAQQTRFASLEDALQESGLPAASNEEAAATFDSEAWNEFVARSTRFSSWKELLSEAGTAWVQRKLEE